MPILKKMDSEIDLLTKREMEILALLASKQSNKEISQHLNLALNSVKWYARQIYSKLSVENRHQAVTKARALNLLPNTKAATPEEGIITLPSGIVTFLFTDIEGAAPLWEKLPIEMRSSVSQYHALLRQAIEANGGQVFQTNGDAFQAAFSLASNGLRAALAAQRALQSGSWEATGPLKVRMGLHTGQAEIDPQGNAAYLVSHTFNRLSNIVSAGHGGQILLSQETAKLTERELPEGVLLKDLGEHYLKGMERPEHFYQVIAPGLPQKFPPLTTEVIHPNNLPVQITSFVGREKEIETVCELLKHHRLVTQHGSGGTGKTRLALQVAAQLVDYYSDGVWLVELASLTDPAMVPQTVAVALGLTNSSEAASPDILTNFLREKQLLLLLDNCEHLLDACTRLAHELLLQCPQLTILATSRETFNITGEIAFRVPSLDAPDPATEEITEELAQKEAVRLFTDRAAAILPQFRLSKENVLAVARICHRLDGIPLAIELAAARMGVLSVDQIADRLDDRFRLLTGGSRTALPRHRTLRASIDWSYSLLSKPDRLLLQRLSVFSGGLTMAAVEDICAFDELGQWEMLDGITSLVNKSLVVAEQLTGASAEPRYHLLESIRDYVHEKLLNEETDQAKMVRNRHSRFYLNLLLSQSSNLKMGTRYMGLSVIDREGDNIQAAIDWLIECAQVDALCEMIDTLYSYYWSQSKGLKGEQVFHRIGQLIEGDRRCHSLHAMQVLARQSAFHFLLGHYEQANSGLETCLTAARRAGDWPEIAFCLRFLGNIARWRGNNDKSRELYMECLEIYEKLENRGGAAWALIELGGTEEHLGDNEKAKQFYEQSLVFNQALDNREMMAICLDKLGAISFYRGEYEKSEKYYNASYSIFHEIGDPFGQALALGGIAWNHWARGGSRLIDAERSMRQSVRICRETGYWLDLIDRIGLYGMILNSMERYEDCIQTCLEGLSISQENKNLTQSPMLLSALAEAELYRLDFAAAKTHLRMALSTGMELQKLPTVSITLYICMELFIKESATMPNGDPNKYQRLRQTYALASFISGSLVTWKIYREKAALIGKDLAVQTVILEQGIPGIGNNIREVVDKVLVLLKD